MNPFQSFEEKKNEDCKINMDEIILAYSIELNTREMNAQRRISALCSERGSIFVLYNRITLRFKFLFATRLEIVVVVFFFFVSFINATATRMSLTRRI